jgi:hypothetical protein
MDWTFREIRQAQERLGGVKTCRGCGRTLPITMFPPPNLSNYRGLPCRTCCAKWPSRQKKKVRP